MSHAKKGGRMGGHAGGHPRELVAPLKSGLDPVAPITRRLEATFP